VHATRSPADLVRVTQPAAAPGDRTGTGRAVGAKSVLRALDHLEPTARAVVLVALDAPATLIDAVRQRAAGLSLTVIEVPTAAALGARCGVARPVSSVLETV